MRATYPANLQEHEILDRPLLTEDDPFFVFDKISYNLQFNNSTASVGPSFYHTHEKNNIF